jgi:hypothetical protein
VRYIFQQNYSDIADWDMEEAEDIMNTGLVHKGLNLAFGCKFQRFNKNLKKYIKESSAN